MSTLERHGPAGRGPRLGGLLRLTGTALEEATEAFLGARPVASTALMAVERGLHEVREGVEDHASALLAVSDRLARGDVRRIVAEVHTNANIEAMADLARQVADIAHSRVPGSGFTLPEHLRVILRQMCQACLSSVELISRAFQTGSTAVMTGVDDSRREVGRLQRRLLIECGDADLEAAIDATLVGRFYERFTEHAVSAAYQARLLAEIAPSR